VIRFRSSDEEHGNKTLLGIAATFTQAIFKVTHTFRSQTL